MLLFVLAILGQTGINAGTPKVSCDGSVVTLQAEPINPPPNYEIQWEDNRTPGVFLVASPLETTSYRVFLTNLDTQEVFEDSTRILVHPAGADLHPDGNYDAADAAAFFARWHHEPDEEIDPDGDGLVTILDWFYFCNFDLDPPNSPPQLLIGTLFETVREETVTIPYQIEDQEQEPFLVIAEQPANGIALLSSGILRYVPVEGFVGTDSFSVYASDGLIQTPNQRITIEVIEPDHYSDLYNDIFFVYCKACHIDAVSGGLSLANYTLAQAGGVSGPAFVAGSPKLSPLFLRVDDGSMPLGMPPLTSDEIDRIRLWIERGAEP